MDFFRPQDWWDRLFAAGIVLKGLDGAAQLAGGILLLLLDPARIHAGPRGGQGGAGGGLAEASAPGASMDFRLLLTWHEYRKQHRRQRA